MLRNILAVLAGVITNAVIVTTAETLTMRAYPLPAGTDWHNAAQLETVLPQLGNGLFLGVLGGIVLSSFLAGAVTGLLAEKPGRPLLVIGFLLLIANALNAFSFWHPLWFRAAALLLPFPLAWFGGQFTARSTGSSDA